MLLLVMPGPHGLHASLCRSSYTRSQEGVMLEALELQILKLVRGTTTPYTYPGIYYCHCYTGSIYLEANSFV